jgi:hypothetical protein
MVNKITVGYSAFDGKFKEKIDGLDIAIFGFGSFSEVKFKNELSGKSETLTKMARLSQKLGAVCFFGATTDSYGLRRKSVIACSDGRLLGISDATRGEKDGFSVSCGYKIYNTKKGKFGVLVDSDICLVDAVKSLSACECDAIIDISRDFLDFKAEILVQTLSYLFGVSICFLCGENMIATTPRGELVKNIQKGSGKFLLETSRSYVERTVKSRGI